MRLCVLLGGDSPERDVSLESGRAMIAALRRRGHQVDAFDPSYGPHDESAPASISRAPADHRALRGRGVRTFVEALGAGRFHGCDCVVLGLHGGSGEDGRVQGALELAGVPFTGSGSAASSLGMNKTASRALFDVSGIPIARGFSAGRAEGREIARRAKRDLGWPVVVKPSTGGSTVGMSVVRRSRDLAPALERAFEHGHRLVIERYVAGREVTVAVLGDRALPVVEIIPGSGFYDYEHKYQDGDTTYVCPAELSVRAASALSKYALVAFDALGCAGYARVDFRLPPRGRPVCLEVNTLPGMTSHSLVPMAAAAAGITFDELCDRIVRMAVEGTR